jgi:hypothetical protein
MTYAKAVVAIVVSALGALTVALGTGNNSKLSSLDTKHWLLAIAAVLASGGLTALVSNLPGVAAGIAKAIVAFLSAGVASLIVALNDSHISQAEWLVAISAAVVAGAAVYEKANRPVATP